MPQIKLDVFKPETNLRRGGSIQGPVRNFWWVRIEVPREDGEIVTGWVSAVRIRGGGNDEPIPGVPQSPTVFAPAAGAGPATPGG